MKENKNKKWNKMYAWMLLVPLFWGGSFSAAEHVVSEIPPLVAAAIRFAVAGILLFVYVRLKSEWRVDVLKMRWKGLLLVSLTGIFGYNAFFFLALSYTSAINGSLIIATMPVFVSLGAILFLKEAWTGRLAISLFLSLLGVLAVITKGSISLLFSLSFNTGDLLFIAALACGVIYGLVGKTVMKDISPLLATAIMTSTGSIFLFFCSLIEGGWEKVPDLSIQGWGEMLYMVICGTMIGYLIFNKGLEQIGAGKASIYLNLTPVVTVLLSVMMYDSVVTWKEIPGILMVLAGVYLAASTGGAKKNKSVS